MDFLRSPVPDTRIPFSAKQRILTKASYPSQPPNAEPREEGVAQARRGARPVDEKENGIGGAAADSEPVPRSGTPAEAREGGGMRPKGASGGVDIPLTTHFLGFPRTRKKINKDS